MLMTIFGVCGSIALLFAGLGVRTSIADLNNRQFTDLIRYDLIVATNPLDTTDQERELEEALGREEIAAEMPIYFEQVRKEAGANQDEQNITLLAVREEDEAELTDFIHLVHRESQKDLTLDGQGAILSEKLAQLLEVEVGDSFEVDLGGEHAVSVRVAGITEMYMGHFIFMRQDYYQDLVGKKTSNNAYLVNLTRQAKEQTNQVATDFMNLAAVRGVVQNTTLKEPITTIVNSLNRVMYILIITSILLAMVILYNLTNINVAERTRELSTIKVLGFYNKEVTLYIYRESIYLSLIGILAGFGFGLLLHRYMLAIIPPDSVLFNPALGWEVYAFPAAVVTIILVLLGLFVNQWLKKVDMLEALKSVE